MILADKFYGMYLHLILDFTMLNTIYGKAVRGQTYKTPRTCPGLHGPQQCYRRLKIFWVLFVIIYIRNCDVLAFLKVQSLILKLN